MPRKKETEEKTHSGFGGAASEFAHDHCYKKTPALLFKIGMRNGR